MLEKIKVLQLQPDYNVKQYDFADLAEQIVLSLPKDRFDVVSGFLHGRPAPGQASGQAQRTVYFDLKESDARGLRLRALWKLYKFCREERFDVVICNRFKPISLLLWLNKLLHVPHCIAISHGFGDYDRLYRRLTAKLLADDRWSFVGVSPAVQAHLIDAGCGAHPGNTVAIMNAIDVAAAESLQYSRQKARSLLALPEGVRLIGTIGRLVPVKGHIHLLRAFGTVADSLPNVHLALIGEGRQRELLEKEVVDLGLEQRVHLLGARPFALRYIKAFDIFVMPSIQEGLGLALLEAMSGRLPVIGSDVPAMRPLLAGAGGRLVRVRDEEDLARALTEYCSMTDEELARLGQQTYDYLVANHAIEDYRQAYRRLVESKLPSAARNDQ